MLALGMAAQTASCAFLYGVPFLLPSIRAAEHVTLATGGLLIAAPMLGLIATLIAWGAAADRFGERIVMGAGLGGCAVLVAGASRLPGLAPLGVLLALAGAAGASVNAASGRVVLGWFGAAERGLVMGIRQMAQPLGVGIAAFALPPLALRWGFRAALLFPAGLCAITAVLVALFVIDPPRPGRATIAESRSPYRSPMLWRVHAASGLLVFPQFVVSAFALEYLVAERDWASAPAGRVLAAVQVAGALGRLAAGRWSDRVASRLRPMRLIAVGSMAIMLLLALGQEMNSLLAPVALMVAAVITVADNGLGYTSTAELAGPFWAGRALGAQNTVQNIAAFITPPLFGGVIGGPGYAVAFAVAAAFPAIGILTVPVSGERAVPAGPKAGTRTNVAA